MADPIPTQGTIPTQPGLSADQLKLRQLQQKDADLARQADLQKAADKSKNIFKKIQNKTIRRGSLIAFQYNFYKHDFAPLCLVGKLWTQGGMISGLNLHYLTFRYIKYLIGMFCGKDFHYGMIKGNQYIVNAYRSYKREGRRQVQQVDCDFINAMLKTARSFKPSEIEAMRKEIQKQMKEKMHPNASQLAKEYQEAIYKQGHREYDIGKAQPDARFNPTDVSELE